MTKTSLFPNGSTQFCFLFGYPTEGSLSPELHTKWFQEQGVNAIYLACPTKNNSFFQQILGACLNCDNFLGGNITMPFKRSFLDLDGTALQATGLVLDPLVSIIGAANTLYKQAGQWTLTNTDVYGIQASCRALLPPATDYTLIVLGGGACALTCFYYGQRMDPHCKKIIALTRQPQKTKDQINPSILEKNLEVKPLVLDKDFISQLNLTIETKYCLIINTISYTVNMDDWVLELALNIKKHHKINEIFYLNTNYQPTLGSDTPLNQKLGISTRDGALMLDVQARESFFLWTGIRP